MAMAYGNGSASFNARYPLWVRTTRILGPLMFALASIPASYAAPLFDALKKTEAEPEPAEDASLWVYLGTAVALVLLGGVFAGLTIALMGQDEIYLQVLAASGEGSERKNAKKVLKLLKRGKHWVLVTLLLGNVITNETLPIVLDRSLGGGWPAVLGSTVLIVIFGEIAPQSVCVRYGLPIGAWMAPFVLVLMYLLSPVAWPTAKLLDYLLGQDHGTTYKKAGLKTLVSLHRTLGESTTERLNEDEVTIISAVLDLKDKPVGSIMTPISDVFTLSMNTVLDEAMMDKILAEGYSRIPIYAVDNPRDFVGMLLVKMLITYDPEDCLKVRDFQLATLPETRRETSCLDIINFFQEGKSHMVLISEYPGEPRGALGVVTLEDVIEELIGEEIVDESDVYVDVHKAIRRLKPTPFNRIRRVEKGEVITDPDPKVPDSELEGDLDSGRRSRTSSYIEDAVRKSSFSALGNTPPSHGMFFRRRSSQGERVPVRPDAPEMRQHLRAHLEPSNLASRPKSTRIGTVTIKPGAGPDHLTPVPETRPADFDRAMPIRTQSADLLDDHDDANETTSLLSAGHAAKDGTHALTHAMSYGGVSTTAKMKDIPVPGANHASANGYQQETSPSVRQEASAREPSPKSRPPSSSARRSETLHTPPKMVLDLTPSREDLTLLNREDSGSNDKGKENVTNDRGPSRRASTSTLGSLHSIDDTTVKRRPARSGSITEQVVEVGGVKKIVLEMTSSSDNDEGRDGHTDGDADHAPGGSAADGDKKAKKKRKKRAGKKKKAKEEENEGSSKG